MLFDKAWVTAERAPLHSRSYYLTRIATSDMAWIRTLGESSSIKRVAVQESLAVFLS